MMPWFFSTGTFWKWATRALCCRRNFAGCVPGKFDPFSIKTSKQQYYSKPGKYAFRKTKMGYYRNKCATHWRFSDSQGDSVPQFDFITHHHFIIIILSVQCTLTANPADLWRAVGIVPARIDLRVLSSFLNRILSSTTGIPARYYHVRCAHWLLPFLGRQDQILKNLSRRQNRYLLPLDLKYLGCPSRLE